MRRFADVLLLAFVTLPVAASEPDRPASPVAVAEVTGEVKDSTGGVLIGATVTLRSASGPSVRESSTNAQGRFRFEDVPAGAYVVVAFREGFSPATREITVRGGEPTTVDLVLGPASLSEEVTVSFTSSHSLSALKTDTPIRDIPLSVESYTSSLIRAVEATKLSDVFNYMTGISRSGNTVQDFTIRGLRALPVVGNSGSNIQYNSLPGVVGQFGSLSTENIERIEVLKGPASVLFGQATPGGMINLITKKPQAERATVLGIRGGTYFGRGPSFGDDNSYHVVADLTGPIDARRQVLYRLVASYDNDHTFRDFTKSSDVYLVPSLSWVGWKDTFITVEVEYRRIRASWDQFLVAPKNDITLVAPITTRYQEPDDSLRENGKTGTLYLKKVFSDDLTWNLSWRSVFHEDGQKGFENVSLSASGSTLSRRDREQANQRRWHFLDTTLKKTFRTGSVRHTLLPGLNGGYELQDLDRRQFAASPTLNVDVYAPVYGAPGLPPRPDTHRRTRFLSSAVYLQDQVELTPKWKALAGVRYQFTSSQQRELRVTPSTTERKKGAAVPGFGLVFEPDHTWSLYSSYSSSFIPAPAGAVDGNGKNTFLPERGRQYESGVKMATSRGRGEANLAVFQITKDNVLNALPGNFSEQIGQERSRGAEVSINQRLRDSFQLIFGYAYTDSVVSKDVDPRRTGARALNAPRHSANVWARYDATQGRLRGLGCGLGLVYKGDRSGSFPTTATAALPVLILPSYFRVDAGLYYTAKRFELTLAAVNLLDELYYDSAQVATLQIRPGAPRAATLSVRVRP